jgi:ribosome recycling factor
VLIEEVKKETQDRMEKAFQHIQDKVKKVRTGSAHSSLLEGIKVSSYGSEQELKHIASISCPDARSLVISPWDQNTLKDIEAALVKSDLGMAPQRDGKVIRLRVPELTEERREELIRVFKKDVEKSRVEFRQIRKMMNEKVRKALKEKQISEDEAKDTEANIQDMTDRFIKQVNELSEKKQKELIRV